MAGFSTPTGIDADGKFTKNYTGMAINGCSSAFVDTSVGIDALTCSGAGSDSIAVEFEADARNSVVSSSGEPLDCLGNGIAITGGYYLSYSRFYINDGKLYCRGSGSNAGDALVDNIDSMVIQYGVANAGAPNQVSYYSGASGMNASEFNLAISARICLIVKSEREVTDAAMQYYDCDGNEQTALDRRLYRAFTSTITLQNRMGLN
jgi:type IV pilus assembly protein PilW